MDGSHKGIYDIILGRDLFTALELNLKTTNTSLKQVV